MNLVRLLILSLVASLSGCAVIAQTPTAGSVGLTVKSDGPGSSTQWIAKEANKVLGWNSEGQLVAMSAAAGGGGTWGSITGTLSAQTDLQNALNAKLSITGNGSGLTNLNASALSSGTVDTARLGSGTANTSTYLRGDGTWAAMSGGISWGGITGTLSGQTDLQNALNAKASLTGANFSGNIHTQGQVSSDGNVVAANFLVFGNSGHYLQSAGGEFNVAVFPDKGGITRYVPLVADTTGLVSLTAEITGTLPIANGGTGAITAINARASLGLAIGSDVQAYDADLQDLADGSLSGSKVGSGINAANITTGTLGTARMGTGTANSTTFLRGDGTWAAVSGGGGITALTGDVTASGTGSVTATLTNSGVTPGTYGPMVGTIDAKGRVTSALSFPLDFPEGLPTMAVDLLDGAMHGIQFLYNAEYPDPPSLDYQRAWLVAGPGVDQRRIILPSVEGTLALTSDVPQIQIVEAHKNGTDQSGLGNGSWVTITWPTEVSDTGSDFLSNALMVATGERWLLQVSFKTLQSTNANLVQLAVYRNGSFHKLLSSGASYAVGASYGGSVILHEGGNYDVRAHSITGQALSASGVIGETWLKAIRLK